MKRSVDINIVPIIQFYPILSLTVSSEARFIFHIYVSQYIYGDMSFRLKRRFMGLYHVHDNCMSNFYLRYRVWVSLIVLVLQRCDTVSANTVVTVG